MLAQAREREREKQERIEAYIRRGKDLDRSLLEKRESLVHAGSPTEWRETKKDRYDCPSCVPAPLPEPLAPQSGVPTHGSSESSKLETLEKQPTQTPVAATPLPQPTEEPSVAQARPGGATQDTASGGPPDLLADFEPPDTGGAEAGVLLAGVTADEQESVEPLAAPPPPAASKESEFSAKAFGHVHKVAARYID